MGNRRRVAQGQRAVDLAAKRNAVNFPPLTDEQRAAIAVRAEEIRQARAAAYLAKYETKEASK